MHSLQLAVAVVLAAARAAAAQSESFPSDGKVVLDELGAAPGSLGGRALAGDVTGDLLPDAVWIRDGKPFVVYGPAAYRSSFVADVAATDLALLAANQPGAPSALAFVNAAGLWKLDGYDGGFAPPVQIAGGAWAGATRVRAGDVDGDGCEELVGLSAAGSLLFLKDRCGAQASAELAQPAPVLDFVTLDWDGAGGDELAVLRTDGFFVFAHDGELVDSEVAAVSGGFLVPLRDAELAHERCAVVLEAAGVQVLVVLDPSGPEESLELGPGTSFFGASAADVDGDGRDDVCLLARVSHAALLLRNRGAPASFALEPDSAELVPLAGGTPSASWSAWPLLADFSLDGDPDLLAYVEGTDELVFHEDAHAEVARDRVVVSGGAYLFHQHTNVGELQLFARVPETATFANAVVAIAWREPDASGASEGAAVTSDTFPLDANGKTLVRLALPEQDLYTTNVYHLDLRAVHVEGVERRLVASGAPAVHAFTTPEYLTSLLEADHGPGLPLRTFLVGVPSGKSTVKKLLGALELVERALAPKDVKTLRIPKTVVPPDPF